MSRKSRASKPKRSDAEEKEHLRGVIRKKDKRIRLLEREVSRLTKYLARVDFDVVWEDDEPVIKAPKKEELTCSKCGSNDCSELVIPQRNCTRKYITCKNCGERSRIIIDDRNLDAGRKQKTN